MKKTITLFVLLSVFAIAGFAQDTVQTENILVFRKKKNPGKAKFFKPNKRIVYRL